MAGLQPSMGLINAVAPMTRSRCLNGMLFLKPEHELLIDVV